MKRVYIATEDNKKVQTNIDNNKLNVNSYTTHLLLNKLLNKTNNAVIAITTARSKAASTYPMATYKNIRINGSSMCKLVAISLTISAFKTILIDNSSITITLHDSDLDYVRKNNLEEVSALGYVAIHGSLPYEESNRREYDQNKPYYYSMGILLNDKDRERCSWMKGIYRKHRHCTLEYIMGNFSNKNILTENEVKKLLDYFELIKNDSSYYNQNRYIYYLCEIVGIVDTHEKNLFMTILSDEGGRDFVRQYIRTKYNTRRIYYEETLECTIRKKSG